MTCMVPLCSKTAVSRGLCPACRKTAERLVTKGDTTWAELELSGKCRPSQRVSATTRRAWFLDEVETPA